MASRFQPPPIIRACERLLVDIEQAVRRFSRYHRYTIGSDLRRQAMTVYRCAYRAWRDSARVERWVERLVWEVDDLRQYLQTAKLIGATHSFRQFEHLGRQVEQVGAQAGGWKRHIYCPSAQNAPAARGVAQRGQKLSTRAASTGANA